MRRGHLASALAILLFVVPPQLHAQPLPAAGTLQFSAPTYAIPEALGAPKITVTRVGGSDGAASVTAATIAGGSATAGTDYTPTTVTLTWADGDSTSRTFTVLIVVDGVVEPDETVNLALSAPSGATLGAQATAVLTIIDHDVAAPVTSIPALSEWAAALLVLMIGAVGIHRLWAC